MNYKLKLITVYNGFYIVHNIIELWYFYKSVI